MSKFFNPEALSLYLMINNQKSNIIEKNSIKI